MAVVNRIAEYGPDMTKWRQQLHRAPELGFECHETARFVISRLRGFGVDEVHDQIATSGVVALIKGRAPGPVIGLRADMDALPIAEETGSEHASDVPGVMHACGHDGHMVMLLGAARYLAETRNFSGTVAVIFQPAEEHGGGAQVMCDEGLMDRFGIEQVYALHNAPGIPEGHFLTTPGPIMAAVDTFHIRVKGRGGHAAMPHETADPITAALGIGQAIQTIVSRNHVATDDLVVSITQIHSGTADNVVPETAYLCGTVRSFDLRVQQMVMRRMAQIVEGQAASYGVEADLDYEQGYPPTVNSSAEVGRAAQAARDVSGHGAVDVESGRQMGAEDFAYMLQQRPGAYLFLGQGDGAGLHHPADEFNDLIAPIGASFFARLVEQVQPL